MQCHMEHSLGQDDSQAEKAHLCGALTSALFESQGREVTACKTPLSLRACRKEMLLEDAHLKAAASKQSKLLMKPA